MIKNCFNRAAKTYDAHSLTQQDACSLLINALKPIKSNFNTMIDLGCGSGLSTQLLTKSFQYKKLSAIDISDELMVIAQQRLKHVPVDFLNMDFNFLNQLHTQWDLVFSNMSLQWSHSFKNLLQIVLQQLTTSGIFAFSIPLSGTFCELKSNARNHYYTHDAVIEDLSQNGLECLNSFTQQYVNYYDSAISALKAIKATGANHLFNKTIKSLKSRSYIHEIYQSSQTASTLTYQIGFYIAKRHQ